MALGLAEETSEYLSKVHSHLAELTRLSADAGMHAHAAIWLTIDIAFYEGESEIETLTHMIKIYLKHKRGIGG